MSRPAPALRVILWVGVLAVLLAVYLLAIRPWFLHWGSTAAEQARSLPGDELVAEPLYVSTRAVTINAPPEKVWPWLAQIGQDRGAFYSYTWIENLLGVGYRNATSIHPEWQQDLKAGDIVLFKRKSTRTGPPAVTDGFQVVAAESGRYFILKNWGVFYLEPAGENRTRLILRGWTAKLSIVPRLLLTFILDPGHFAMEKRMALEVKRLAEGRPGPPLWVSILAWVGFVAAAALAAVIIARRRKWPWLALPLAYFLFVLLKSGDIQAALVGFLALSLIIAGFVVFRWKGWVYLLWWWIFTFSVLLVATDAFVMFGVLFLILAANVIFLSRRKSQAVPAS